MNPFQLQISLFMNQNRKNKLPPSPSSSVCRKPLLNITNLPTTEILKQQKLSIGRPEQSFSLSRSTKNIKSRISIDQFSKPKLKQVHSRRSNRSDSMESNDSRNQSKQKNCKHHRNRRAMHQTHLNGIQYLCFECSLIYAKQGHKIKAINSSSYQSQKSTRQKQTIQYLQQCNIMHGDIISWRKQHNKVVKQIYEQFGQAINNQKNKMEEELTRIRDLYMGHIKSMQQCREQKLVIFQECEAQIQKYSKIIESTRADIQTNYQDCLKVFTSKQFRQIMDQYWKHIKTTQIYLKQNSIPNLQIRSNTDIKLTVRTMQRSDNVNKQFTFSKDKKYQTPPFSKQLRGIKVVESQQDSNRYPSSSKESIVDTKFNLSDFNI